MISDELESVVELAFRLRVEEFQVFSSTLRRLAERGVVPPEMVAAIHAEANETFRGSRQFRSQHVGLLNAGVHRKRGRYVRRMS